MRRLFFLVDVQTFDDVAEFTAHEALLECLKDVLLETLLFCFSKDSWYRLDGTLFEALSQAFGQTTDRLDGGLANSDHRVAHHLLGNFKKARVVTWSKLWHICSSDDSLHGILLLLPFGKGESSGCPLTVKLAKDVLRCGQVIDINSLFFLFFGSCIDSFVESRFFGLLLLCASLTAVLFLFVFGSEGLKVFL